MTDRETTDRLWSSTDPIARSTDRRAVLKGVAVAGVALPFLAACGGGNGASEAGSSSGSGGSGGNAGKSGGNGGNGNGGGGGNTGGDVIATTNQVPEGGGIILPSDGVVVTQPGSGDFKAFSDICTHMGCPVSSVSGGTINCNCHGSQYSITDGSVVGGPAPAPLPAKQITVKGKNILLG